MCLYLSKKTNKGISALRENMKKAQKRFNEAEIGKPQEGVFDDVKVFNWQRRYVGTTAIVNSRYEIEPSVIGGLVSERAFYSLCCLRI